MIIVRNFFFVGIVLFSFSDRLWAQNMIYHLHKENSSTSGMLQLKTGGPDASRTNLTASLRNKAPGEYLIKAFDTQAGVPNLAGAVAAGSTATFTLWMRKTANNGTMFPRAKLMLNSVTGTVLCTATGTTALTTTLRKYTLSCPTAAAVTMSTSDRYYLWVGVNITVGPRNNSISGQVSIEGTLNGNYDSQVNVPLPVVVPPPVVTECSDGIDNDFDQLSDLNDPDCSGAADTTEAFFRAPLCAPDGEYRIVVIYMNTPGNSNRFAQGGEQRVRDYVSIFNGRIWKEAQKFGASRDIKVKCSGGVTEVVNLSSPYPGDITGWKAAAEAGYNSTLEHYWIFLDSCHDTDPANCYASGGYAYDAGCASQTPGVDNCENHGPRHVNAWGNMMPTGYWKWLAANVIAQESFHGMGVMACGAPHNDGPDTATCSDGSMGRNGAHGNDGNDVMSAGPLCKTGQQPLDCNNDDFFHPNPFPGNYLYNHWNLAASYVRWFDDDGVYPWTGYNFDAEHLQDSSFYPREMTRTTTVSYVPWTHFNFPATICSIPPPPNAATNGLAVYGFAINQQGGVCNYPPEAGIVASMTFSVDLARTSSPTLSWWDLFDIRNACTACDYMSVDYSTDGGSTWNNLWRAAGPQGDQPTWVEKGPYNFAAGCNANVKIRFQFDTMQTTSTGELGKGWFVDGIKVAGAEGGCNRPGT